jgi:hypothetical protein
VSYRFDLDQETKKIQWMYCLPMTNHSSEDKEPVLSPQLKLVFGNYPVWSVSNSELTQLNQQKKSCDKSE